jgi:hypothetical protein
MRSCRRSIQSKSPSSVFGLHCRQKPELRNLRARIAVDASSTLRKGPSHSPCFGYSRVRWRPKCVQLPKWTRAIPIFLAQYTKNFAMCLVCFAAPSTAHISRSRRNRRTLALSRCPRFCLLSGERLRRDAKRSGRLRYRFPFRAGSDLKANRLVAVESTNADVQAFQPRPASLGLGFFRKRGGQRRTTSGAIAR